MNDAGQPLRIVQVSDIHCGTLLFDADLMRSTVERTNALEPDLIIVVGDLTSAGYEWEFNEAAEWIAQFDAETVVVQGNHDARNVGYLHFQRLFGDRYVSRRIEFDEARAQRLRATGLSVVAVDSSVPDLNEGHVGREWYEWIRKGFIEPDDLKIFVLHHHLVSIPGTGRDRNIVTDAGDVLQLLADIGVDVILSGHKHVPFFWGLNGMLIVNSGTASTRRVRGLTPPSWNEIVVDTDTIEVFTHYEDGRRELSVVRSRADRSLVREALTLTDEFRQTSTVFAD
ncbi:MAG: metallophosphoesterase [Nitriliruptorales bacterium]|nr:metallophosphoesterase [Nitriliruptorales bacterium]